MRVGIAFGDNDFFNTFWGVLNTLLWAYKWKGELPESKEELVEVINALTPVCYRLYQRGKPSKQIVEYMKVSVEEILIGNEVDEYLAASSPNSDTFILDTDLDHSGSDPVYAV